MILMRPAMLVHACGAPAVAARVRAGKRGPPPWPGPDLADGQPCGVPLTAASQNSGSGALYGELLPIVAAVGHGGWPAPMRMN